jgi:hypothetical protein
MTSVRRSLGPMLVLFLSAGCSFVDPQAGAAQAACGISGGGASQTGPGAAYYAHGPNERRRTDLCHGADEPVR